MNNFTNIIVFILSLFLLIRGATRGFLRSLLMPFSIIVATIISIIYLQITQDMIVSLLIGLIGPFVLNILFMFLIKSFAKASNNDIKKPTPLSALGGAIVTLAWGWVLIIVILLLIVLMPPWDANLKAVQANVLESDVYTQLAKPLQDCILSTPQKTSLTKAGSSSNPGSDAKSLAEDPRFQKIIQDPEIQKDIDAHDIVKLMSNPKMMALTQQIMSDPDTLKRVMAVYSAQAKNKTP